MMRAINIVVRRSGLLYVSVLALVLLGFGLTSVAYARPKSSGGRAGARARRQTPRTQVRQPQRQSRRERSRIGVRGRDGRVEFRMERGRQSLRSSLRGRDRDEARRGTSGGRLHLRGLHGIGRLEYRPLGRSSSFQRRRSVGRGRSHAGPIIRGRYGRSSRIIVVLGGGSRYYSTTRYYGSALYGIGGLFFWYEYPSLIYRSTYRFGHPFGHGVHWWRGHVGPRSGVTVVLRF